MLAKRIIPCLDVKDGTTVKGVQFINFRDAGDPVEHHGFPRGTAHLYRPCPSNRRRSVHSLHGWRGYPRAFRCRKAAGCWSRQGLGQLICLATSRAYHRDCRAFRKAGVRLCHRCSTRGRWPMAVLPKWRTHSDRPLSLRMGSRGAGTWRGRNTFHFDEPRWL